MADAIRRPRSRRLTFWLVLVAAIAALNYSVRFSGGTDRRATGDAALYSYSTFAGGMLLYAVWLGLVLLICVDRFDLLALRPPQSWRRAARLAVAAIVAVWICEYVASLIPLPQSPGDEQGLANVHWEPAHAGAFATNVFLFAVVAPFVEELTFRGAGQSLLRFLGRTPSIILVGIAFGLDRKSTRLNSSHRL